MRHSSKKQAEASRANGRKGGGPTSAAGKAKSRLNSWKDGLFSKSLVVEAAGERVEDFESLKAAVWDSVQPEGAVQEMLADDIVANFLRRQRVRLAESADLKRRLENLEIRHDYLSSDEIEPLKFQFRRLLGKYVTTSLSTPSSEVDEIVTELEKVRSQLASTSDGLRFLTEMVKKIKDEATSTGCLSDGSITILRACAGFTHDAVSCIGGLNQIIKADSKKAAQRAAAEQRGSTGQTHDSKLGEGKEETDESEAERRAMLIFVIETVAGELKFRSQILEGIETQQDKTRAAAAILPDDNRCERFHRAETAFDRRIYRALAALLTLKQAANDAKRLP